MAAAGGADDGADGGADDGGGDSAGGSAGAGSPDALGVCVERTEVGSAVTVRPRTKKLDDD
jgi:hypothetical protein